MTFLNELTEFQRKIYQIAKDYLQKYPNFTLNELFLACKRDNSLSDSEIYRIIETFIEKKIFVPGSRLTKDNILKNELRYKLYQLISKNPGINFSQIINHFKIGPNSGSWHLEMLKKFGLICERKFANYKIYFHQFFPEEKQLPIFLLRNPNSFNIYLCLKNQYCSISDLAKILDLHYSTVQYHVDKLHKSDLIISTDNKTYTTNPEFDKFLIRYYDFSLPPELENAIELYISERDPDFPTSKEDLEVDCDFDYDGGTICFKINLQNKAKMTISKIDIMITTSTQYSISEKVKTIDFLLPDESQDAKFFLIPLVCGKSQVYATISYTNSWGFPRTFIVPPREIGIKCPLVVPSKAKIEEIDTWKTNLPRGTSSIQLAEFSPLQVFETAYKKIKELNLAEIHYDETNNSCTFTGLTKIDSKKIVIEVKLPPKTLTIDVWTNDMRDATGILAFLRNHITKSLTQPISE